MAWNISKGRDDMSNLECNLKTLAFFENIDLTEYCCTNSMVIYDKLISIIKIFVSIYTKTYISIIKKNVLPKHWHLYEILRILKNSVNLLVTLKNDSNESPFYRFLIKGWKPREKLMFRWDSREVKNFETSLPFPEEFGYSETWIGITFRGKFEEGIASRI